MSNQLQTVEPTDEEKEAVKSYLSGKDALEIIQRDLAKQGIKLPANDVWKYAKRKHIEEAVHATFQLIGGVPGMIAWAKNNPTEFYKGYMKLVPQENALAAVGLTIINTAVPESPLDVVEIDKFGRIIEEVTEPSTTVNVPYVVRKPFIAFHARSKRRAILVYHRRSGKTVATVNDLVAKALRCRKKNGFFAYIAPFMGQAVQTAWQYLQEAVRTIPGHKVDLTLKLVKVPSADGSFATIRLFGADNPNALRGLYFDGVVLDEVADMKKMVWTEVIQPALMDRMGWAVFIGTPKGKNFFYDLWEQAKQDPETWFSQMLKASESGILRQEDLEAYAADVDEETYAQEMECSFTAGIKGAYYASTIAKMEEEGRMQPFAVVKAAPVHVVFDLGWADATAAWFFQLFNGELRVVDHEEWNEVDIHKIIKEVVAKGYKMGDWWLPHDAKAKSLQTGKSMIEQFRKHGINPKAVPELDVLDGIQAVRQTLPKVLFNGQACYQGIECLKNYQKKWNAELGVFSKHPLHDWASHSADSFRYLCLAVRDKDVARTGIKQAAPETPREAHDAWVETTRINTTQVKGLTFDELFAKQPRRGYVRI